MKKNFITLESHPNDSRILIKEDGICQALNARMGTGGGNAPLVMETNNKENEMAKYVVRRLTPLECERLQGFPDGWTDIPDTVVNGKKVKCSDSARYKALGNSIAIPQWYWLFQRLREILPENAKLGSLFDGIGGFPLAWEEVYGKGTARWASEIEPFPIAVTMHHFGGEE